MAGSIAIERNAVVASSFAAQLQAELDGIQGEIDRLEKKRDLIRELLQTETGRTAAPSLSVDAPVGSAAPMGRRRAARRGETGGRRPRGLITGKVREFLAEQTEPVHATAILDFLERNDAAPQSAKPLPTLQSTLQRMKEMGEVRNHGRNQWALTSVVEMSGESAMASDEPAGLKVETSVTPLTTPGGE